jgi:phenylacetate-CoA ligase
MYFEIIDPKTGQNLPDGKIGELVVTTLAKEGAPLIRYRTRDLTRIIPGACACGSPYPRIDTLIGRTDDMVKVKGVNIYPGQLEDALRDVEGVSSEYQVMIDHLNGKDIMTLFFETELGVSKRGVENAVKTAVKRLIGLTVVPMSVAIGELPRSEKKTTRIFDNRY